MKLPPALAPLQRGVTLIELLVSLAIGLIIMIAVIGAYLGASGAGRTAEAIGRMNEDGQMALTILSQQLRMAGVNPSQPDRSSATIAGSPNLRNNTVPLHNTVTNAYAVRGCDLSFSNVTSATATSTLTCGHSASSSGPNSISIAYEADKYNTVPASNGQPTDCVGTRITPLTAIYQRSDGTSTATFSIYEAENRFYIGTSTSIINPTLYCKGNGSSSTQQPIVENVENLQFRYGTANPATTTSPVYVSVTPTFTTTLVVGYLSAYEVDNDTTALTGAAGSAARWNAVKTVRICVVIRSEKPVLENIESARYIDCNGTLTTPADKRLRRAFSTTVVLRNQ